MGKGFLKFKRKLWIGAIIRALLFGLSAGASVGAVLLFTDKMTLQAPDPLRYGVTAGIVASVGALLMLLILLPTSKRVARKLDRSLALGEKAQTMLAFRKDESPMAVMQREDTDRILQATPGRKVKGTCTFVFALLPLLAVLMTLGSVLTPAKEPEAPPPVVENNFALTPWQEQALKDLIEEVKASEMEAQPKEDVVKQLESLLIKLRSIKKEPVMKETVIATVVAVHEIVSIHNTYDLMADSLYQSPAETLRNLGSAVDSLKPLLVGEWMNNTLTALETDPAEATALSNGILAVLHTTDVPPSNEVYTALADLAAALEQVTGTTAKDDLATLMAKAEEDLNNALFIQSTNEEIEDDTIYTLLSIFGIKASEVPDNVFNDPDDPRGEGDYEQEDDLDEIHGGGLGSGDMIFGSDDTLYDPDSEQYVAYGSVIGGYYAKITELITDVGLPAELEEMVSDYFAILFNGSENKENTQN